MRMCQPHWDKLRQAIKDRGISHLVAKSGEEAVEAMKSDLAGQERDYDPLMDCHWMITSRALASGGLYLMQQKEDGTDYCPICEAVAHGEEESFWIDGPADAALGLCIEKGLVPSGKA